MPELPGLITSALMLILPLPLFVVGFGLGIDADRHPRLMRRLTTGAAGFALVCAILAAGAYSLGMTDAKTYFSAPLPARLGLLSISVDVNRLTVLMVLLVAVVGVIVARYAYTYLDGDTHEGRFHRWLSLTLSAFFMLIASGNLWEFLIFSIVTSLFLNHLLAFYRERPVAVLAARKKYFFHRMADASLFAAIALIIRTLHTSQFAGIAPALAGTHGPLPESLQMASGLLVLSAVLKSAQFPFHGWLVQVMEAPTPVSALLHAGIIYTGAFLLLRMAPIMSRVLWSGDALIIMGLVSITTASLMMMTATNIKGSLAYSTCAQMGFMLMECGLGLYSLALLHIVSHSVYKAHAFLSSGSVVDHYRGPVLPVAPRDATMWTAIGSLIMAALVVMGTGCVVGGPLLQTAPRIVITAAISQLLWQAFNIGKIGVQRLLWLMISLSALISAAYFGLDSLFTTTFGGLWPPAQASAGIVHDGILGLISLVFAGLLLVQQMRPRTLHHPIWQAIYVHLYNDLYIDMLFTRLVRRFGPGNHAEPLPVEREDERWEGIS